MTPGTMDSIDIEQERLQRLAELGDTEAERARENYQPGTFGCHELLDRTACVLRLIDEWVLAHPACLERSEWFALAHQATEALSELYQNVGSEHLDSPSVPASRPNARESDR